MPLPYENTTSGEKALGEIQKLLRTFGCSKFGSMIDDAAVANGMPSADELSGHHVHVGRTVAIPTCCQSECTCLVFHPDYCPVHAA